ncbi:MAG TPA: hypothetical protein VJA94_21030 [Candidatus Angelobacter sp.]
MGVTSTKNDGPQAIENKGFADRGFSTRSASKQATEKQQLARHGGTSTLSQNQRQKQNPSPQIGAEQRRLHLREKTAINPRIVDSTKWAFILSSS